MFKSKSATRVPSLQTGLWKSKILGQSMTFKYLGFSTIHLILQSQIKGFLPKLMCPGGRYSLHARYYSDGWVSLDAMISNMSLNVASSILPKRFCQGKG